MFTGLAIVGVYYAVPASGGGRVTRVILYCAVSLSAAFAVCYGVHRNRPAPRVSWLLLGLAQLVYAAADTVFYVSHYLLGSTAYPSLADIGYLSHYPLVVAGLALLIRHRTPGRDRPALLDAGVLAVSAALLSWLFLIGPQARFDSPILPKVVSLAYPVMDLALLAVALRLILGAGRRPAAFVLLTGGLTAILVADTVYVIQQLSGAYTAGNILDMIWLVGNLCLGAAALHPTMRQLSQRAPERTRRAGPGRIALLCAAALVAPGVLMVGGVRRVSDDIIATSIACALLFGLTIARLAGLLAEQKRLAVTDALTGLYTRRYLEERLATEAARGRRSGQFAVFIIDVDHFKSVNDRHGHLAGDRALVEIAGRLRAAIRPGDVLARHGGEEFALLCTGADPEQLLPIAERLRRAVGERPITLGPEVTLATTVSVGAVIGPGAAGSPEELIAAADRALYRAKARGRDRVAIGQPDATLPAERVPLGHQTPMIDYLRRVADEVDRWLAAEEHSSAISRWATTLSEHMGHDDPTRWRLELAGRLHDIGKIVVPQTVLTKPGLLTEEEWLLVRRHPDHGARLARLVPDFENVAESIRQHHERFDGTGYPDMLAGTAIRLEARIIAVCDSWAAMRSNRAYQAALAAEEAREQLWLGRGTQFDPEIVDLFLDLQARGLIGDLTRIAPGRPHHAGDPARSDSARSDSARTDPARTDPAQPDPARPDSAMPARVFQKLIS